MREHTLQLFVSLPCVGIYISTVSSQDWPNDWSRSKHEARCQLDRVTNWGLCILWWWWETSERFNSGRRNTWIETSHSKRHFIFSRLLIINVRVVQYSQMSCISDLVWSSLFVRAAQHDHQESLLIKVCEFKTRVIWEWTCLTQGCPMWIEDWAIDNSLQTLLCLTFFYFSFLYWLSLSAYHVQVIPCTTMIVLSFTLSWVYMGA